MPAYIYFFIIIFSLYIVFSQGDCENGGYCHLLENAYFYMTL